MSTTPTPSPPAGQIKGVFSSTVKNRIGTGATKRITKQQVYVFAEQVEPGVVEIQPLNRHFVPAGQKKRITVQDLLDRFIPEPQMYTLKVSPAMEDLEETVQRGEDHYSKAEYYSAEYEFKNALRIDEESIRATFGLGLTYLDQGLRDKGDTVFRRLVKLQGAFEPKHKHLFNDFGIKLRKNGMLAQALKYYSRALKLSKYDDHLLYNMGRTLFEKGNHKAARNFMLKALKYNPEFVEGRRFLTALEKHMGIEPTQLPPLKGKPASEVKKHAETDSAPTDHYIADI